MLRTTIDSAVNKAIEKFKTEVMQPMLKHKDDEIKELKSEIKQKNKRISDLESKVLKSQYIFNQFYMRKKFFFGHQFCAKMVPIHGD